MNHFQQYKVISKTLVWDEKFFYVQHEFISKGKTCALLIVKIRVIENNDERPTPKDNLSFVITADQIDAIKMNEVIEVWSKDSLQHWQQNR